MIRKFKWGMSVGWVVPLVAATLACALPGQSSGVAPSSPAGGGPATGGGGAATAGGGSGPASPTTTAVYVGTAGEGDPIDLCALATPDEVKAVLGGPATHAVWDAPGQNCVLFLDQTHFLIVQAGHDADGKSLHVKGMEGVRAKITDQAALQLLDEIEAQQANLTLLEVVEKGLPVWQAAGFTAEQESGVGDWSFWYWGYQELGTLGEWGAGRASGAWVAVYATASDEASAKALLKPLAAALLDRLPDNFTPAGNGY